MRTGDSIDVWPSPLLSTFNSTQATAIPASVPTPSWSAAGLTMMATLRRSLKDKAGSVSGV